MHNTNEKSPRTDSAVAQGMPHGGTQASDSSTEGTTTPRKILFLDIDGVVNHKDSTTWQEHFPLDRYCAFLVGKIQLDTGCDVVLSSSWRKLDEAVETVNKRVVKILDKTGNSNHGIRGVEIHEWLTRNVTGFSSDGYQNPAFRIAILDDDSDMLLWQKDCFFQTNFMQGGLTDEIAARVTAHLNS